MPAAPVKKTLSPLITLSNTACCSGDNLIRVFGCSRNISLCASGFDICLDIVRAQELTVAGGNKASIDEGIVALDAVNASSESS